jgi:prepilin-type N-terminal cleavage/methylation domain-containing protein
MRRESGFSLVELMVAMTITLIVSGAIYGLLTAGGNAFRREPEVADRQQNIRAAMDLIARDVYNAGAALPTFAQAFTRVDPTGGDCDGTEGLNGCGAAGTMGEAAKDLRGLAGDTSENTDVLEIVTVDERCPIQTVCSNAVSAGAAGDFVTREGTPACLTLPGLVLLTDNTAFTIQPAAAAAPAACSPGGNATRNGSYTLLGFLEPWDDSPAILPANTSPPPNSAPPQVFLYRARIVRYQIAPSTDPLDTSPALWRSETGLYTAAGGVAPAPGTGGSPWEIVARGIEDLQLEYAAGVPASAWDNRPPISAANDWNTLVRQVRIGLSARAIAPNLQGQTRAAGGAPDAVRGQLVTVVAPRAAFGELQMGNQIQ